MVGDAADAATLIQAHVARARLLAVALPDAFQVRKMIEIARTLNPRIRIVARSHSAEEAELLRREHGVVVLEGERELALSMIRHVESALREDSANAHA